MGVIVIKFASAKQCIIPGIGELKPNEHIIIINKHQLKRFERRNGKRLVDLYFPPHIKVQVLSGTMLRMSESQT